APRPPGRSRPRRGRTAAHRRSRVPTCRRPYAGKSGDRMLRRLRGSRRGLLEAAVLYAVYLAYRATRTQLRRTPHAALHNARQVIGMERAVHLFHEARVQGWFLHWSPIVRGWNVYYGGLHFAVPVAALLLLWRRDRARYRFFRNVFGWMLLLGLIGFAVYPVTPPRLLAPAYRFVDTGATVGGIGAVGGAEGNGGG